MTKRQHMQVHKRLHIALDRLVADWIAETNCFPSKMTVLELLHWSKVQTQNPSDKHNVSSDPETKV
jgi:hypothetical protein